MTDREMSVLSSIWQRDLFLSPESWGKNMKFVRYVQVMENIMNGFLSFFSSRGGGREWKWGTGAGFQQDLLCYP